MCSLHSISVNFSFVWSGHHICHTGGWEYISIFPFLPQQGYLRPTYWIILIQFTNKICFYEQKRGGGGGGGMPQPRPPNTPLHVCGLLLIDRNFYAYLGFSCVQQADTDSGPNLHLSGGQWNKYKRFSNGICDGCFSKTWFRVPYRLYLQRRVLCCLSKIWLL